MRTRVLRRRCSVRMSTPTRLGAYRDWGVEAKIGPSEDSFCQVRRLLAIDIGQEAGEKWTAAVNLQPTLPKPDRLLAALAHLVLITTQHALRAIFEFGAVSVPALTALRAYRAQLAVYPRESLGPAVDGVQPEDQPLARFDKTPDVVDGCLHHCIDSPHLGAVPDGGRIRPASRTLPSVARCSSPIPRAGKTDVELALRQPGEISVGSELRVKLLVDAVVGVQGNDVMASSPAGRLVVQPCGVRSDTISTRRCWPIAPQIRRSTLRTDG